MHLLDLPRVVEQLVSLERRASRTTGRSLIDHAPGGHDDMANVLAGAVHLLLQRPRWESDDGAPAPGPFNLSGTPWWWPPSWDRTWWTRGDPRYREDLTDPTVDVRHSRMIPPPGCEDGSD